MHILQVFVRVKPERVEEFKAAIIENARSSMKEAGVARFDVLQQQDDPTRFVLVEAYRRPEDHAKHRETAHYNKWKAIVEEMMAEPRKGIRYTNVFPDDSAW